MFLIYSAIPATPSRIAGPTISLTSRSRDLQDHAVDRTTVQEEQLPQQEETRLSSRTCTMLSPWRISRYRMNYQLTLKYGYYYWEKTTSANVFSPIFAYRFRSSSPPTLVPSRYKREKKKPDENNGSLRIQTRISILSTFIGTSIVSCFETICQQVNPQPEKKKRKGGISPSRLPLCSYRRTTELL